MDSSFRVRPASLLCCAAALACASAAPRELPRAPAWAAGSRAFVQGPSFVPNGWSERDKEGVKTQLEDQLRAAGLQVLAQQQGKGELFVVLGGFDWAKGRDEQLAVTLLRDGAELERISFAPGRLTCIAAFDMENNIRCISREVAARVLESRPAAEAMKEPPPTQEPRTAPKRSGRLAVLELRNFARDLTRENAQYFTDVVRAAALKAQPQLEVMTRENLLVLLKASGKSLEECEGECEVDTGRRIGADEIVSGELQKLGSLYKLSLRLHDTREGRLLASTQASGRTIEELDAGAQQAALDLLSGR